MTTARSAEVERTTRETSVRLALSLDGGPRRIEVPSGFFGHMLEALAAHGGLGLEVAARGDTHVDRHASPVMASPWHVQVWNRLPVEQRITDGRCDPDDLHRFSVVRRSRAPVLQRLAGNANHLPDRVPVREKPAREDLVHDGHSRP